MERRLVGFVELLTTDGLAAHESEAEVLYRPIILEIKPCCGGEKRETFWLGEIYVDEEDAANALAAECRRHGMIEEPEHAEWGRPV